MATDPEKEQHQVVVQHIDDKPATEKTTELEDDGTKKLPLEASSGLGISIQDNVQHNTLEIVSQKVAEDPEQKVQVPKTHQVNNNPVVSNINVIQNADHKEAKGLSGNDAQHTETQRNSNAESIKSSDHDVEKIKHQDAQPGQEIPKFEELSDALVTPPPKPSWPKRVLNFVRAQWFLITMVLLVIIASQVQVPEDRQERKNDLVGYISVSVIFFLTGCTLNTKTLIDNYSRWKVHLWVQIQCFFITSLLMFAIVSAAATKEEFMDPGLLCGMILTGCVATTISSNVVMTGQAGGNQALTVTQSTLGNIIGVFLTPALFKAYTSTGAWYTAVLPNEPGGNGELYRRVFKRLGLSVFIPLFVGQVVHNIMPNLSKTICGKYKVGKLGSVALLVIIWSTYDSAFSSGALYSVPGHNIAFVVLMSVLMFIVFLSIAFVTSKKWLDRPDTVACCYCIPAKSPAIGIPLSTVLFAGLSPILQAKLQLPLVLYQGLQILAGTILTIPFKDWVERGEKAEVARQRLTV